MDAVEKKHRALLNSTMRELTTLFHGHGVTLLAFDVNAVGRFKAARQVMRAARKAYIGRKVKRLD